MTNAQNASVIANPPHSVFTLSATEGMLAFAVAGSAWLYGPRFSQDAPPIWVLFAFCNALAVCAVCAVCAAQVTLLGARAGLRAVSHAEISLFTPLLIGLLFVSFPAHFLTSCAAALRGLCRAESRGDLVAFPLFFAWILLFLAMNDAVGFRL